MAVLQQTMKRILAFLLLAGPFVGASPTLVAQERFVRGDANCDGCVRLDDAIWIIAILFTSREQPCDCEKALDADDDGSVDPSDAVLLLNLLFDLGDADELPDHFSECRTDPTADALSCVEYPEGSCAAECQPVAFFFRRGDVDVDGVLSVTDAVWLLQNLVGLRPELPCGSSADVDDNGRLELADAIFLLGYLFSRGPLPPRPFPRCDLDRTLDDLICGAYPPCEEA